MSYRNKRILFMGDSITALGGWVNEFNKLIKPSFFVNIAVGGARWADRENTVYDGNPVLHGPDNNENNTMCNQLEKLLRGKDKNHTEYVHNSDYDSFDTIIVAAGTNDIFTETIKNGTDESINLQFICEDTEDKATLPIEKADRHTWAGAMRYVYENLRKFYPNADIFFCSPIQAAELVRPYTSIKAKGKYMKAVCDRISDVTFINTFECGICGVYEKWDHNLRDLIDGLHPNDNGAKKIARYNANAIMNFYGFE